MPEVANALGEQDRLNQNRDVNVEAFELFLRGREPAWTATRMGCIAVRGPLERAIAINPNNAAAHAIIAKTHLLDYANGFSSDPELSLRTGFELAQRVVRTRFQLGQHQLAVTAIEQRLVRSPNSETAYALLASCYGHLGRPEESRQAWAQVLPPSPKLSMVRRVEGLRQGGVTV